MVGPASPSPSPSPSPAPSRKRVRLLVLYGGRSAEHDVSCVSAKHVVEALDPARFDVRLVGITTDGRWVDATAPALEAGGLAGAQSLPSPDDVAGAASGSELSPVSIVSAGQWEPVAGPVDAGLDAVSPLVVLPLVHGPMGEDGTVQGLLELAGLPYCGPGVAGSATAMDKGLSKALLEAAGLPQARYLFRHETEIDRDLAAEIGTRLGWPAFVKPANMGSSIGITRVVDPAGLEAALELALRYDEQLVIEESVSGREIEMGVLGWPHLRFSLPGEIRPSRDFYDFDDKYRAGAAGLEIPALVPDGVAAEMGRLAISACRALRVDSMARVDFFYEEEGRGLLINEINTIPGFTPISMYPRMWAASGVSYPELIDILVEQALRRAERRSRFETRH